MDPARSLAIRAVRFIDSAGNFASEGLSARAAVPPRVRGSALVPPVTGQRAVGVTGAALYSARPRVRAMVVLGRRSLRSIVAGWCLTNR